MSDFQKFKNIFEIAQSWFKILGEKISEDKLNKLKEMVSKITLIGNFASLLSFKYVIMKMEN